MLKRAFIFCFYCLCWQLKAQPLAVPEVPHKMNFAGITLTIRDDARREIQKDVDALMQSPKHYQIKVERAKAYFPIIEKIFAEEKLPDDFKYLVLQESALIGNAVSVSNAVGFWQFKDFTAKEVGMRVDDLIDERMNIVSATRGAARYIKKNNYQFEVDKNFLSVIKSCGEVKRKDQDGTWIDERIINAYTELHQMKIAHSFEIYFNGNLVGGLYGIILDDVFFGESMFHYKTDASKIAFVLAVQYLKKMGVKMIDCQMKTKHLLSFGAKEITRNQFIQLLNNYIKT